MAAPATARIKVRTIAKLTAIAPESSAMNSGPSFIAGFRNNHARVEASDGLHRSNTATRRSSAVRHKFWITGCPILLAELGSTREHSLHNANKEQMGGQAPQDG